MLGLILAQAAPGLPGKYTPSTTFIGHEAATALIRGIMFYSLIFCLVGLVLSAGLWAVGSFSNNYTQSVNGKKGFLVCAGAALAIGAAQVIINYFFQLGGGVPSTAPDLTS